MKILQNGHERSQTGSRTGLNPVTSVIPRLDYFTLHLIFDIIWEFIVYVIAVAMCQWQRKKREQNYTQPH